MSKQKNKVFIIFILAFISLILISTYVIEYKLGYEPCKLCLYERVPYFVSFFLITVMLIFQKFEKITLIAIAIVFVVSTILAFYHFGIEEGFFNESLACAVGDLSKNLSKEELLEQLKQNSISCKNVNFQIFGLSLAAINVVFSFSLSVIFAKLFLSYGKNK